MNSDADIVRAKKLEISVGDLLLKGKRVWSEWNEMLQKFVEGKGCTISHPLLLPIVGGGRQFTVVSGEPKRGFVQRFRARQGKNGRFGLEVTDENLLDEVELVPGANYHAVAYMAQDKVPIAECRKFIREQGAELVGFQAIALAYEYWGFGEGRWGSWGCFHSLGPTLVTQFTMESGDKPPRFSVALSNDPVLTQGDMLLVFKRMW